MCYTKIKKTLFLVDLRCFCYTKFQILAFSVDFQIKDGKKGARRNQIQKVKKMVKKIENFFSHIVQFRHIKIIYIVEGLQ